MRFVLSQQTGTEQHDQLKDGYRSKIASELRGICNDALGVLKERLVPEAESGEPKTFYLRMQGDYYRYLAEFAEGDKKQSAAQEACNAYSAGMQEAASLRSKDPVRLGL